MTNIYLVGFMSAGKSSAAEEIARQTGRIWIDLDERIQIQSGWTIPEIFQKKGEEGFRKLETEVLFSLEGEENLVVSCGGGTILGRENREMIRRNGWSVLLTAEPEIIFYRLKEDPQDRPLLKEGSLEEITELLRQRETAYQEAGELVIATDGKTVEQVVEEVLLKVEEGEREKETLMEGYRRLSSTKDQAEKGRLLEELSELDPAFQKQWLLWDSRYFFTNKHRSQVGDRYIWLYLMTSTVSNTKASQKEFEKVYREVFSSTSTKHLVETFPEEFRQELVDAGGQYLETLTQPPKLWGILPQRNESETARQQRIAGQILKHHLVPLWKYSLEETGRQFAGEALLESTKNIFPKILPLILSGVSEQPEEFRQWMDHLLEKGE